MEKEKEYYNIVMGDWNSKVGQDSAIKGIKGPYRTGEMIDNGERLTEFAGSYNFKVANTFFKKKKELEWTWRSPVGQIKNEIDHMLISDMRIVANVVCLPAFVFPSDHRIICNTLNIKERLRNRNYRKKSSTRKYVNIILKYKKQEINIYCSKLLEEIKNKITAKNQQEWYDRIEKAILDKGQKFDESREEIKIDENITDSIKKQLMKGIS